MADAYPSANIIGVDLSPIQPGWFPSNCRFYVDDAEQTPWEFDDLFDVIHLRNMEGAFADWQSIYRNALENLRPGGIVEVQSQNVSRIYSLDRPVPVAITAWLDMIMDASRSFGRNMDMSETHKQLIEEAGFVEVEQVEYKIPLGPWAKHDKPLAEVFLAVVLAGVESYSLDLLTRQLQLTVSYVHTLGSVGHPGKTNKVTASRSSADHQERSAGVDEYGQSPLWHSQSRVREEAGIGIECRCLDVHMAHQKI
jgi:SAM-dependent methyltransferase